MRAPGGADAAWTVALVGALALAACADEDACPTFPSHCSIARVDCQRQIFAATACTRGQEGARMPPIRAITRAEYAEELHAEASDEDDFGERAWSRALALFGLIPSAADADETSANERVSDVLAYYDSDEKNVTLITDSLSDPQDATFVLSHEFAHALQDQREDLGAAFEAFADTTDDALSLRCLIEGEAVMLSNLSMPYAFDARDADWDTYFGRMLAGALVDIAEADAPIYAARSLVYPVGGRGVVATLLKDGSSGVAHLYDAPPPTFRGWGVGRPSARAPEPMDCAPPDPPEGYEQRHLDRQGVVALVALYAALGGEARYDDAHAWVSDWYAVYAAEDESSDEVAVAWRIRFGSRAAADRFAESLDFSGRGIEAERQGQEVLLTAASSAELLESWERGGGCDQNKAREAAKAPPFYRVPRSVRRWRSHAHHRHAFPIFR